MSLHIVILAAGQGKRMYSKIPKVLHNVGGQPMLARVVETAQNLQPEAIHVIIGHGSEQIREALPTLPVNWITQEEQLGTGHAVLQALPHVPITATVLVLYADVPLIQVDTLQALVHRCHSLTEALYPLVLLLASVADPTGLGRVVRDSQEKIQAIIEEKDASAAQRQINEIYSGICCAKATDLSRWLPKLTPHNAQKEYYLTDIINMAVGEGLPIESLEVRDCVDIQGVNNRLQLEQLERAYQRRVASQLMLAGVTLADASRIDIRGQLQCGMDVFIDVNTVFSGNVTIGEGSSIGPNCILNQVTLGAHCEVLANSVLDNCHIEDHCQIGPFARLRPGTRLSPGCKIGNFVETKNAVLGNDSKANHLSYLGDVTIGKKVNIGAGTITCNYDGAHKHQTIIEDGVFIGSDTQLVAPVTVGENATIGAGSTIRRNVPAGELTLTEAKQKTIYGWTRPKK